jgi:hypothetical protein
MAQVTTVTSESLQAKIRQLLPSQQGFGEDLQASNVILPIIDLTETASGSILRQDLQKAWDSSTGYNKVTAGTTTIINNTGFWKIQTHSVLANNGASGILKITDGLSTNEIFAITAPASFSAAYSEISPEFTVFLRAGDSVTVTVVGSVSFVDVWYRNIADINGNLNNPTGFTSE